VRRSNIRLLCDQNVDHRYLDAFRAAEGIEAVSVREVLDPRSSDPDIAAYAAANGYVVFTCDDDFFGFDRGCGLIYYEQETAPRVGTVVAAIQSIGAAYDEYHSMVEVVPDGWV